MDTKYKTIGVVDWYNEEKGYGVIRDPRNNKEYFIHISTLPTQMKRTLSYEDVVLFIPAFDSEKNREIATNIRFHDTAFDINGVIEEWLDEECIKNEYVVKIIINYLRSSFGNKSINFKESYHAVLEVFSNHIKKLGVSVNLYSLLKTSVELAFGQSNALQFSEVTDILMMEKIPSDLYTLILNNTKSIFVCFKLALRAPGYTEQAINKAFDIAKTPQKLLEELIRFTKEVNSEKIGAALESNKNNITNEQFWNEIVGKDIVTTINKYIFSSLSFVEIKNLIDEGYVYNWDNAILMDIHPDYYKKLKISSYTECKADSVDVSFIEENIDWFSAADLIKIKHEYNIPEEQASRLFLFFVRYFLNKKTNYREFILFYPEVHNFQDWITDNHAFLAENGENEYQDLLIWLYKNNHFHNIDADFIVYYIDRFSINEILTIIKNNQVSPLQKESILSALFVCTIGKDPLIRLSDLKEVCNNTKEFLGDQYTNWINKVCAELKDEDKYILWKERISELYPDSYIRNQLLSTEERGYMVLLNLCQDNLITREKASMELWYILNAHQDVPNRPIFYKILYSIKYLVKLDEQAKEPLLQKENEYYNIILWFLYHTGYTDTFDFETLKRVFIYFLPSDQVCIIKRLFYMKESQQIKLDVEMLDSITRVDDDLFHLITKEHPDVPIDVSTEIIIKALKHLSETGNFIADKEVLNILIQAGRYNKRDKFRISEYFDECKGRKTYKWDGHRKSCGKIEKGDTHYCVTVLPYIVEGGYTRNRGYNNEDVWNSSFHAVVDAIKQIKGKKWNATYSYWEIPLEEKESLFAIASEYGLSIEGTNNAHMHIYKETNEGKPARVNYCEGRPALKKDSYHNKEFLWCRNGICFNKCVEGCHKEYWNYTLLDLCRILKLDTNSVDSEKRIVQYGKYLSFVSIINRANSILDHLYCRECGEMLEPVQVSNYYTQIVTHFHCTNPSCRQIHKSIYISKCFNWKCNGVIDDRDTKKCPNGWNICPECGSCCSNRIAEQRISHCREIGITPNSYFYDFINHHLGHLEKREFYCYQCGRIMYEIDGKVFECSICGVKYERKMYDFEGKEKVSMEPI